MRKIKAEESIGKKYGRLTVMAFAGHHVTPNGRRFIRVTCMCECGNECEANLTDIRCGKTKTCGLNHPQYTDRSIPAFNSLYNHTYRRRALDKGLEFSLTEEEFRDLTQSSCHYCGTPPSGNKMEKCGKYKSVYVYNGVDRKNNELGYTVANSVTCCSVCNHAKHTMSYDAFLSWIDRVSDHQVTLKKAA